MSEDASATYRGFRNQALYVLYRILTDEHGAQQTYCPEGAEDLAIYDSKMLLVEVVQVKDLSSDLSLSNFKPESPNGFFARFTRRMSSDPNCRTRIATFGHLGPELGGALKNKAPHRKNVISKIIGNPLISESQAVAMLDHLNCNVIGLSAAELLSKVRESILQTIVGGDPETSLDLLMYWIFKSSEERAIITRSRLVRQLELIGEYLSNNRDYSSEWNVSISPVTSAELTQEQSLRWKNEYRLGVQARWEHILAGADSVRQDRIDELHHLLNHHSVVIIRGASGQGKSTLGWRYLHDYYVDGIRFHVRLVTDREHALKIANALSSHVSKLKIEGVVYIDVSPADFGWGELVRSLAKAGLKVIVSIREEDFRRANIAVGDFSHSELVLDRINRQEAELIYSNLRSKGTTALLDFEETWAIFAAGDGGPLLEFTYLVTQGESLKSRIKSQISRLQSNINSASESVTQGHLDLLALAAIANETGARVSLRLLCLSVQLNPLTSPLQVLDNEYLVRLAESQGETFVTGLHQLRSQAIVQAIFEDSENLWVDYAVRVLPMIADEDIEIFLLTAFSRHPTAAPAIFKAICNFNPQNWTQAAGLARSLVWEGVNKYEETNRCQILKAIEKYNKGWWIGCDSFIGMDKSTHENLLRPMAEILKSDFPIFGLTNKNEIFSKFSLWASEAEAPKPPLSTREWSHAGEVAFWIGHANVKGKMRSYLQNLLPSPLPTEASLTDLSQYISGRSRLNDRAFKRWLHNEAQLIRQMFLRESDSLHLTDDGEEIKVFFSVPISDSATKDIPDAFNWNQQAMKRVELLHQLFPNRNFYASQGFGLEPFVEQMGHDPTLKRIESKSLPLLRCVRINQIFSGIVTYRNIRPNNWKEYATEVFAFRVTASDSLRKLNRAWSKLLTESSPKQITLSKIPLSDLEGLRRLNIPAFPKSAVDEWGFISEEISQNEKNAEHVETMQERSLRRFDTWRKSISDYESGIELCAKDAISFTIQYLESLKGVEATINDNVGHLLLYNLGSAWSALDRTQNEFRNRFGQFFGEGDMDSLEVHERSNIEQLWKTAFAMRYGVRHKMPPIQKKFEADFRKKQLEFASTIENRIKTSLDERVKVHVQKERPWIINGVSHLCIVCDHSEIRSIEEQKGLILKSIHLALKSFNWLPLEWKPVEVEWPEIALVELVSGKLLQASITRISTLSFFVAENSLETDTFYYSPTPQDVKTLNSAGFFVWENPLLRQAFELQVSSLDFTFAFLKFQHLAGMITEENLEQDDIEEIFVKFNQEFNILWEVAKRCYANLSESLVAANLRNLDSWNNIIKECCEALFFDVDPTAQVNITLNDYENWAKAAESASEKLRKVLFEIIDFSIAIAK